MNANCPCGSGQPFAACCQPYLRGDAIPPSAEALMRSRYSAFVARDWDYIDRTQVTHDDSPPTPDIEWLGLKVRATSGGSGADQEGTVEFVASYQHQGKPGSLHEVSRFRKQDGRWIYVDGEFPKPVRHAKVGRNDPCPCGSGKKYKKCCALDVGGIGHAGHG